MSEENVRYLDDERKKSEVDRGRVLLSAIKTLEDRHKLSQSEADWNALDAAKKEFLAYTNAEGSKGGGWENWYRENAPEWLQNIGMSGKPPAMARPEEPRPFIDPNPPKRPPGLNPDDPGTGVEQPVKKKTQASFLQKLMDKVNA